ncbi:hypothetical protein GOODEAATRI_031787, partial [Goodea atripinnis]
AGGDERRSKAYQMKSVQWLQKVGCLNNVATNLWSFTSRTFLCHRETANLFPTSAVDDSFKLTSVIASL